MGQVEAEITAQWEGGGSRPDAGEYLEHLLKNQLKLYFSIYFRDFGGLRRHPPEA